MDLMAQRVPSRPRVGDRAPDFKAVDEQGQLHRLADYKGKTFVLYFYLKDNTSGCTAEACGFRDCFNKLARKGVSLLGASPDGTQSHDRFAQKLHLQFPLLADPDKKLCEAYGVWKTKVLSGRRYMGVERSTFLIGPNGKIKAAWRNVKGDGHVEAVLKAI